MDADDDPDGGARPHAPQAPLAGTHSAAAAATTHHAAAATDAAAAAAAAVESRATLLHRNPPLMSLHADNDDDDDDEDEDDYDEHHNLNVNDDDDDDDDGAGVGGDMRLTQLRSSGPNAAAADAAAADTSPGIAVLFQTRSDRVTEVIEAERKFKNRIGSADTLLRMDAATEIHVMSDAALLASLNHTSATNGLTPHVAEKLFHLHGANALRIPKPPVWRKIAKFFLGGFGPMIWGFALLCFLAWKPVGDPPDPVNLGLAVVLCLIGLSQGGFAAFQEHHSGQVMSALSKVAVAQATVIRDGQTVTVPATTLVVGDVVLVNMGGRLPADVRWLEVHGLKLSLANLTGESEPVTATTRSTHENFMHSLNMGFLGSDVIEGSGKGVIVATGNQTVMGKIAIMASQTSGPSSLERDIGVLVIILSVWAVATAVFIAILWGAWLRNSYPQFMSVAGLLTTMVGVGVTFIPEGLPMAVGLALTATAKRMHKSNILVRALTSVETLGSVDTVCSDKTGTLTQNKMHVGRIVCSDRIEKSRARVHRLQQSGSRSVLELLWSLTLCNNATIATDEPEAGGLPAIRGDASDSAILRYCSEFCNIGAVRLRSPRVAHIAFNSRNKWMLSIHDGPLDAIEHVMQSDRAERDATPPTTLARSGDAAGAAAANPNTALSTPAPVTRRRLLMKGAAELMLKRCTRLLSDDGLSEGPAAGPRWEHIVRSVEQLSNQGYRMIAVCKTDLNSNVEIASDPHPESLPLDDLCFVGMVGLVDPPRPDVPLSIKRFHTAGVKVVMVTGDHPGTATAIARQVGIVRMDRVGSLADFKPAWQSELAFSSKTPLPYADPDDDELLDDAKLIPDKAAHHDELHNIELNAMSVRSTGSIARMTHHHERAAADDRDNPADYVVDLSPSALGAITVTGMEIPQMTASHWDFVFAHRDIVFARTTPEQKLRIVKEYQARGHCVAVTGDGVNDSPALRQADIGVCMGSGSEVAKEASDIVLLDDSFSSILVAVEHGRLIFENLKKVILYLMPAGEWAEVMPVLVNVLLGVPLALSSFLMICTCAATDIAPALALVKEHAERDIMRQPPRNRRQQRFIDWRFMVDAFLYKGMIISLGAFIMFFWYMQKYGGFGVTDLIFAFDKWTDGFHGKTQDELNELLYTGQSVYFIALVEIQFGHLFSTRTRYLSFFQHNPFKAGPHRSFRLIRAMCISIVLAILIIYVPFIQDYLNTRPPPTEFWFAPFSFSVLLFALDETRKRAVARNPRGLLAKLAW
ncbi:Na/K-ATPase alpha 1 subunit [Capsaspora owczarzaki ATCC 30864]|uniref:Na/K-ATPase alpha 1 subunit n=1 Tax=Capsaspora owczarzaki (strain ATCC 30864) TaxID=595528 RepID=A0A0D2X2G2_CAPO3|nr:Na/K-ATPase alpha 1 subunit [Capsaspora owczarzaki ATCC 30864]KJE92504.1 Na/K-ATPase alpha 1 subunit [Capsaspora owczarzaki ATCC 30864]|eukprot:XP_004364299.1 Na/K-ATPase alpha 1 subunit [Capsaspora owczarzaki ATCC 30864]